MVSRYAKKRSAHKVLGIKVSPTKPLYCISLQQKDKNRLPQDTSCLMSCNWKLKTL